MVIYSDSPPVSKGRLHQIGPSFRVGCGDSTKGRHHAVAVFECDCGNKLCIRQATVRGGATLSCGCFAVEKAREMAHTASFAQLDRTTHGYTKTPTYSSWNKMRSRCYDETNIEYFRYGLRGITVCDAWVSSFEAFLKDMGERPPNTSLDRIDPNGNYCLSNCRWADAKTQTRNTRRNVNLTIGNITKCVAAWAELPEAAASKTIYNRLYSGWSPEEAVFGKQK